MGCASSATAAAAATPTRAPVAKVHPVATVKSAPVAKLEKALPACFAQRYDVKQELGRGCFGQVFLCANKETQDKSAVKIIKTANEKQATKAERERKLWEELGDNVNVVRLLDSYVESEKFFFVMERCQGTILESFKIDGSESGIQTLFNVFHQVFLGLQHIHSAHVVHRDMKAPNLLVDMKGRVKIADFGLSVSVLSGAAIGSAGSAPFMSPEMVKEESYTYETDIWSCGALMYHLMYGEYAYDAPVADRNKSVPLRRKGMLRSIATDEPKPEYKPVKGMPDPSSDVRDLIKTVLDRDVKTRPNAEACAQLVQDAKVGVLRKSQGGVNACKEIEASADTLSTACPSSEHSFGSRGGVDV